MNMMRCKTAAVLAACLGLLAACGGGGDDGLQVQGPVDGPYCPADPGTFVGPLPAECGQLDPVQPTMLRARDWT